MIEISFYFDLYFADPPVHLNIDSFNGVFVLIKKWW